MGQRIDVVRRDDISQSKGTYALATWSVNHHDVRPVSHAVPIIKRDSITAIVPDNRQYRSHLVRDPTFPDHLPALVQEPF